MPKPPLRVGTPCKGCDRALRPACTTLTDYPDTVLHAGGGMCSACYAIARAHPDTDLTTLRRCLDCPRVLRANTPGPRCGTCTRAHNNTKTGTGTLCKGCDRPLRPRGTKLSNHPGTVAHKNRGMCSNCIRITTKPRDTARPLNPRPTNLTGNDDINRRNLDKFLQARRNRGVPPEGIPTDLYIYRNQVAA